MSQTLVTSAAATLGLLGLIGAVVLLLRRRGGYGYKLATRSAVPQSASDGDGAEEADPEEVEMRQALGVGTNRRVSQERRLVIRDL